MESIISDFHVDWHLLLAQLFNFSVVVAVLYFFAFKPIVKMMSERSDKIAQGLEDAEVSRLKLAEAENDAKAMSKEAKKQADGIIADANKQAADSQAVAVSQAKEKVKAVIEQEKAKMIAEKNQIEKELHEEGAALAVALAEKLLNQKMDASSDLEFVKQITK